MWRPRGIRIVVVVAVVAWVVVVVIMWEDMGRGIVVAMSNYLVFKKFLSFVMYALRFPKTKANNRQVTRDHVG
jgi:hypothetical protein